MNMYIIRSLKYSLIFSFLISYLFTLLGYQYNIFENYFIFFAINVGCFGVIWFYFIRNDEAFWNYILYIWDGGSQYDELRMWSYPELHSIYDNVNFDIDGFFDSISSQGDRVKGCILKGEFVGHLKIYRPDEYLSKECFYGKSRYIEIEYNNFRLYQVRYYNSNGDILCFQEFYREPKESNKWISFRNSLLGMNISKKQLELYDSLVEKDEKNRKKHPELTNELFEKMKIGLNTIDDDRLLSEDMRKGRRLRY